jgi:flagellar basal body P-ring protein FlgI
VGLSSKARIETKDSNKEGEDLKKSATIWNSWTVNMNINSTYGKKSSLEIYNRKELYLIVKFLEDAITLARLCEGENEAYLIADIIFMNICNVLDSSSMKKIQNSLLKLRT